jgi:hypothetical protein
LVIHPNPGKNGAITAAEIGVLYRRRKTYLYRGRLHQGKWDLHVWIRQPSGNIGRIGQGGEGRPFNGVEGKIIPLGFDQAVDIQGFLRIIGTNADVLGKNRRSAAKEQQEGKQNGFHG